MHKLYIYDVVAMYLTVTVNMKVNLFKTKNKSF